MKLYQAKDTIPKDYFKQIENTVSDSVSREKTKQTKKQTKKHTPLVCRYNNNVYKL